MLHFFVIIILFSRNSRGYSDIAWTGGPMHLNCEYGVDLFKIKGQYIKENVIAIKAVVFKEDIYVLTPRLKSGVLASIWLVSQTSKGVELQPFPELSEHSVGDCNSLQNAVDFHLDNFGNLWVLDSGIIETQSHPRCTCQPKVVVISLLRGKITRQVDLSSMVEPTSLLQNIAVEYTIEGKSFVYISDASRGAVLVHDISANTGWSVLACAPAAGLQMSITKKGLAHYVLILVRVPHPGLIEMDTGALRRQESGSPMRVFNEHTTPLLLLGSGTHHIFLRHTDATDILSWDAREAFNSSRLTLLHSPVPHLVPTSVSIEPLAHTITILDSNYAESVLMNSPTYHRITFIDKFLC